MNQEEIFTALLLLSFFYYPFFFLSLSLLTRARIESVFNAVVEAGTGQQKGKENVGGKSTEKGGKGKKGVEICD